ncbi:hypothetical protein CGRA01v4_13002 [Colletotrichum graminicola]|nr:hypothetical protein CGRA01v4_13002 [Colletotrichum graminicola]
MSSKPVASTLLYAASYAGAVTSLDLQAQEAGTTLEAFDSTTACAPNPSWLTLYQARSLLCCADRDLTNLTTTIYSFRDNNKGSFIPLNSRSIINRAVSSVRPFFLVLAELCNIVAAYEVNPTATNVELRRSVLGWDPRAG